MGKAVRKTHTTGKTGTIYPKAETDHKMKLGNQEEENENILKADGVPENTSEQLQEKKAFTRHKPKKKARSKFRIKHPFYWVGLVFYTGILLFLAQRFLTYTDQCLGEYEAAQPEKYIDAYVKKFASSASEGTLMNEIEIESGPGIYETEDIYSQIYRSKLENIKNYTFEKDSSSYITEEPVYDIFGDGELIAKATLSASNERTIYGILSIMDWNVKNVEAVQKVETHDYTIWAPDTYRITVNGVTLTAEQRTGKAEEHSEFENILSYVDIPEIVEYQVSGLVYQPDIQIYDITGAPVEYEMDEDGTIAVGYFHADEVPQAYYDTALLMAKAWDDFVTDDLEGASHGLAVIQQYLIRDSYYWNNAVDYANSIDITFISPHTLLDPPYSNVQVTDFSLYSENCFSCHVYFEKNMYLTVTGQTMVNTIDSIFYFVQYDDTDDGVDNPHWTIADMEAYVNENP